MDKLYIIIPAYNEKENIKSVIDDWYRVIERYNGNGDSRLVIINDGSTDDTYSILCEYAKDKPLLLPLTKPNSGHGATVLYGYNYAIDHGADFVFQTDSDGQTISDEFDAFWALRHEYNMVIGWRNHREDGLSRRMVTGVLKLVLRLCFHVSITDPNTPFRLMDTRTLKKHIGYIPEGFNLSNVILSVIYAKKKLKVKFMPITFRPRQGGVNSINIPKIFKIGRKALSDFVQINKTLKGD